MELKYTNEFLLDIIQEHVNRYREVSDEIVEVVVEGETIDDQRITTFRVVTSDDLGIHESTQTRTGDPIKFAQT